MSKNLITVENSQNGELSDEAMQTLVTAGIVPQNTPPAQVKVFAHVAKEKGLSAFSKEVYLVGYGNKYSVITGIDGFRKIAARTGEYAGCDDAKFDLKSNGTYKTVSDYQKGEFPISCTVTVYRIISGVRCPFSHTAKFSEFSSGQQKWNTMPFQMIMKVAEAFAIKKAFSDALSGLHIEEEKAAFEQVEVKKEYSEEAVLISEGWLSNQKEKIDSLLSGVTEHGIAKAKIAGYLTGSEYKEVSALLTEFHRKQLAEYSKQKLSKLAA